MERKTRIVCTIGPASRDARTLGKLLAAGMNVARLNFSHGTADDHRAVVQRLRRLDPNVTIMQDLAGPKLRIGEMADGSASLRDGETFTLVTKKVVGDARRAYITFASLPSRVRPGDDLYLADGIIHLRVEKTRPGEIVCRVIHGGVLASRKGLNVPRLRLSSALSAKDRRDLEHGLAMGVDYVAVSFVTRSSEIARVQAIIRKRKSKALVVAKIEKEEALRRFEGIVEAADAVMIARGDLGVEIAPERVPIAQKEIIDRCQRSGKPVIVATQMLVSMVGSERPTRAEASDVANAVFDGADALMLSEETAAGEFPVESVKMMDRIIRAAEAYPRPREPRRGPLFSGPGAESIPEIVSAAVARSMWDADGYVIACLTHSGRTARLIARHRPVARRLIAFTDNPEVVRRMGLVWGTEAILIERLRGTEGLIPLMKTRLRKAGVRGLAVLATGIPLSERGFANTIHVVSI
jgi:pyruvate kinase